MEPSSLPMRDPKTWKLCLMYLHGGYVGNLLYNQGPGNVDFLMRGMRSQGFQWDVMRRPCLAADWREEGMLGSACAGGGAFLQFGWRTENAFLRAARLQLEGASGFVSCKQQPRLHELGHPCDVCLWPCQDRQ